MKISILILIFFIFFMGCSFIESKSFYETFINPELEIEINTNEGSETPDLESVPESK